MAIEAGTAPDPNASKDDWNGHEIVPYEIPGKGYTIVAAHRRNIKLLVAKAEFYFDSLTIGTKEKIDPIHGSSKGRPYALLGGDIDGTGKVELTSWLQTTNTDVLRMSLFDAFHEGRAVYFNILVTYTGDAATGGTGQHKLVELLKCKANSDSWNFPAGGVKSSFDFQYSDDLWFGRTL